MAKPDREELLALTRDEDPYFDQRTPAMQEILLKIAYLACVRSDHLDSVAAFASDPLMLGLRDLTTMVKQVERN